MASGGGIKPCKKTSKYRNNVVCLLCSDQKRRPGCSLGHIESHLSFKKYMCTKCAYKAATEETSMVHTWKTGHQMKCSKNEYMELLASKIYMDCLRATDLGIERVLDELRAQGVNRPRKGESSKKSRTVLNEEQHLQQNAIEDTFEINNETNPTMLENRDEDNFEQVENEAENENQWNAHSNVDDSVQKNSKRVQKACSHKIKVSQKKRRTNSDSLITTSSSTTPCADVTSSSDAVKCKKKKRTSTSLETESRNETATSEIQVSEAAPSKNVDKTASSVEEASQSDAQQFDSAVKSKQFDKVVCQKCGKCNECGKQYKSESGRKFHVIRDHMKRMMKCVIHGCTIQNNCPAALKLHIQNDHKMVISTEINADIFRVFLCAKKKFDAALAVEVIRYFPIDLKSRTVNSAVPSTVNKCKTPTRNDETIEAEATPSQENTTSSRTVCSTPQQNEVDENVTPKRTNMKNIQEAFDNNNDSTAKNASASASNPSDCNPNKNNNENAPNKSHTVVTLSSSDSERDSDEERFERAMHNRSTPANLHELPVLRHPQSQRCVANNDCQSSSHPQLISSQTVAANVSSISTTHVEYLIENSNRRNPLMSSDDVADATPLQAQHIAKPSPLSLLLNASLTSVRQTSSNNDHSPTPQFQPTQSPSTSGCLKSKLEIAQSQTRAQLLQMNQHPSSASPKTDRSNQSNLTMQPTRHRTLLPTPPTPPVNNGYNSAPYSSASSTYNTDQQVHRYDSSNTDATSNNHSTKYSNGWHHHRQHTPYQTSPSFRNAISGDQQTDQQQQQQEQHNQYDNGGYARYQHDRRSGPSDTDNKEWYVYRTPESQKTKSPESVQPSHHTEVHSDSTTKRHQSEKNHRHVHTSHSHKSNVLASKRGINRGISHHKSHLRSTQPTKRNNQQFEWKVQYDDPSSSSHQPGNNSLVIAAKTSSPNSGESVPLGDPSMNKKKQSQPRKIKKESPTSKKTKKERPPKAATAAGKCCRAVKAASSRLSKSALLLCDASKASKQESKRQKRKRMALLSRNGTPKQKPPKKRGCHQLPSSAIKSEPNESPLKRWDSQHHVDQIHYAGTTANHPYVSIIKTELNESISVASSVPMQVATKWSGKRIRLDQSEQSSPTDDANSINMSTLQRIGQRIGLMKKELQDDVP
ncbi:unnamed protein product [Anisakis simplex]|uniref:C2H2-type domain-containing protein n=1 Tax=Anisakis simplex TaxID=6269 RepID=A0A0M3IYP8_ANISI|nr:unnamed protein product [Anisakis simplex]